MIIKKGANKVRPAFYVVVDGEEAVATNEKTETAVEGHLVLTPEQVLVWTGDKQPTIDNSRTLIYDPLPTVSTEGVMMIEE